ncbi:hypothetical protein, partial [Enterobacter kobei]|uniref:hypothetical protein n=1 Tax=Enterobacter kobei TaxID=208224 RepID=UPI000DCD59DF
LKSIESSIPFNQLYPDLTSDKQIKNESELIDKEIELMIKGLLEQFSTRKAKNDMLEQLTITEPFMHYPHLIEHYKGEH